MNQKGLTLTELLIVLFIIGLGWFTLLPRLDMTRESNDPMHYVNILLQTAGEKAISTNTRQQIFLIPGRDFLEWNNQRHDLSGTLSRAVINGKPVTRTRQAFNVYPTGHMDELFLVLSSGEGFRSSPLALRIAAEHGN